MSSDTDVVGTDPPSTPQQCEHGDPLDGINCKLTGLYLVLFWVGLSCIFCAIVRLRSWCTVTPAIRRCRGWFRREKHVSQHPGRQPNVVVVRQEQQQQEQQQQQRHDRGRRRASGEWEKCNARDDKRAQSKSHHQRYFRWHHGNLLKIPPEHEFGVRHSPAFTTTPTPRASKTALGMAPPTWRHHRHHPQAQHRPQERRLSFSRGGSRSSMSSSSESCSRSVLSVAARVKDSNSYNDHHTHIRHNDNNRHNVGSRTRRAVAVVDDPKIGAEATLRGGGWMVAANGRL